MTPGPMFSHFYSDPHFGHRGVIEYCDRPFVDVEHMDAELVRRYNAVVAPGDVVCWVGDCFFHRPERAKEILSAMVGRKVLVRGNHDGTVSRMLRLGFDVVVDRLYVRVGERDALVCHFPYRNTHDRTGPVDTRYLELRPERKKGEVLIHGHTHTNRRRNGNQIHVGVDAWDFAPATWAEVEALVREVGPQ